MKDRRTRAQLLQELADERSQSYLANAASASRVAQLEADLVRKETDKAQLRVGTDLLRLHIEAVEQACQFWSDKAKALAVQLGGQP